MAESIFSDDSDPQGSIFLGVRFVLFGFDPSNEVQLRNALVNGGAVDVGRYDSSCTHVIVHRLTRDDPVCVVAWRDGKTVVNGMWIVDSIDLGRPADANHALYMPVKDLNGIPEFQELHVCLTGYQKQERYDIMRMVELLGAKFSKPLVANKVTHLVCYKFEGEKYELAKKMGIKLVNHRWLEDSLRAWNKCPEHEYSKSSWELEFLDAEAGDSEEETGHMGYGRSLYKRENGGDGSYMNGKHGCVMKDGKRFEMKYNNGTVRVSSSTPNKILENVHILRDGTPDKGAVDGGSSAESSKMVGIHNNIEEIQVSLSIPNKVLEIVPLSSVQGKNTPDKGMTGAQNFEASLLKENGQAVEQTVERTPTAELGEIGAGYYDTGKVVSGSKICNQTPYSDAFGKRTPPSCSSGTSKLSCASYMSKDPSNRLSFPPQSSSGKRSISPPISKQIADDVDAFKVTGIDHHVSGKTDALTMNQVPVMTATGVASPGSNCHPGKDKESPSFPFSKVLHTENLYFEKTQSKSAKRKSECSERGSSSTAAVDAHNILKNNLDRSDSNTCKVQSVETAEDRMDDPPAKKLSSFKRKLTKRQAASSTNPDTPQAKFSGLHVEDQTVLSNKVDAHLAPVGSHVTQGGGWLEMNSNPGETKSLDSGSISNQENKSARMSRSMILLNGQYEPQETDQKHGELAIGHNLSPKKSKTGESAESCEDEMSGSSSKNPPTKITKAFTARKYPKKRLGMNARAPFDAKCGSSPDEGVTTTKLTNVAEQATADAQYEALEGKKNFGKSLSLTTGKVLHTDQENNIRPGALRPSNKANRKSAAMGENGLIDDHKKHSTECKQPKTVAKVSDSEQIKFEQANEHNVFALKSAEGRENIKRFLGPKRKNCRPEVPKSSSKLKQKTRMVNEANLDADKENRPTNTESQNLENLDNGKKHAAKKIVSKFMQAKSKRDDANSEGKIDGAKVRNMPISKQFESQWFILSGHHLQRKEFQQAIKNLRGRICRDSHHWCYQATHFIVPDPLRRTEKFFAAAAAGRWVLKTDYLVASSQAGKFLNEEPFEWYGTGFSEDGAINLEAPRKWRLLRQRTGHGALYGMNVIIYGECIAPSLDTLKRVVKAGDGSILATSPPYHRFLKSGVDFAIVSPGMPRVDAWIQEFLAHNVPCVLADYLVEFVCKPGFSLDRHVVYNTHAAADKSHANHLQRLEEVIEVPSQEDDILCSVCKLGDRAEVMLICGDDAGKVGCGVAMHIDCCHPPFDSVPEDDWLCSKCSTSVLKKGAKKGSVVKRKTSLHVK